MADQKNSGIYLNNVSEKMIHERQGKNGTFYSVGVGINGRIGNISVSEKSIHDKDGRKSVWLSNDPNYELQVYFGDTKERVPMTAQAVHDAYEAGRAAYKAEHAAPEQTAPAKEAAEATAPAKENKSNILWLNGVSPKLVHERMGSKGPFYSVAFDYKGGLADFTASPKQVRDGRDGKKSILLGEPDQVKHVSFKGEDGNWQKVDMTAKEILDSAIKGREEYKAAREAEQTEERTE